MSTLFKALHYLSFLLSVVLAYSLHSTIGNHALGIAVIWGLWIYTIRSRHVGTRFLLIVVHPLVIWSTLAVFLMLTPNQTSELLIQLLIGLGGLAALRMTHRLLRNAAVQGVVWSTYVVAGMFVWHFSLGHPGFSETQLYLKMTPPSAPMITDEQKSLAMEGVRTLLQVERKFLKQRPEPLDSLAEIPLEGPVFVSLYSTELKRPRRAIGLAKNLGDAIYEATLSLRKEFALPVPKSYTMQVDVVGEVQPMEPHWVFHQIGPWLASMSKHTQEVQMPEWATQMLFELEPGVDGVRIIQGKRFRWVLPNDPIYQGWWTPRARHKLNKWDRVLRAVARKNQGDLRISKFQTSTWAQSSIESNHHTVFRGSVLSQNELTSEQLKKGIFQTAQWLKDQLEPRGTFDYEYFPQKDKGSSDYNVVRHAGTTYSLLRYAQWAQEHQMVEESRMAMNAGVFAFQLISAHMIAPGDSLPGTLCFKEPRRISSGGNALALMSYLYHPELHASHELQEHRLGLVRCLERMVDSRGAVFGSWEEAVTSEFVVKEPLYFPGEVLLALVMDYQLFQEGVSLEVAKKIANFQIQKFHKTRRADHWVIQGVSHLYHVTQENIYAEAALQMAKVFMQTQVRPQYANFADETGTFQRLFDVARTTRAGSRLEALADAWTVAKATGSDTSALTLALQTGAKHLLDQQFNETNTYFLPKPERVLGAIPMGLVDLHCRIDNNQHVLIGLLGVYDHWPKD